MSKTLLSRIKPRHNPKPSSSPSFSFKPLIKRLVNELCDILKTHHHNQWQDTLETRLSEEEIVPSDIAHLVLDRIRDPELGLKFFDWVTQRPYGCSLDGFAYSSLLKLLASCRVFSEIETVLESMKVEDKLPTREALDAVIRAYSDSGLVDKAPEIYTTVLSTSNFVPSVLACNSLLNALVKEGRIEIASRGKISKPVVAWVSGTCARLFKSEVQFGHAGAKSGGEMESAQAKIQALHDAGAVVPTSFEAFETVIKETFEKLLRGAMLLLQRKFKPPQIPEDLNTAIKSGKVQAPTHIISSISDDRGEEPCYAGIPMSSIVEQGYGVGDVISLLWFKRSLPRYCTRFIEVVCAWEPSVAAQIFGPSLERGVCRSSESSVSPVLDLRVVVSGSSELFVARARALHSGTHDTIVTARAGKDLVSSLVEDNTKKRPLRLEKEVTPSSKVRADVVRSGFLNTQKGASDGCQDGNKVSGQLHRYEHLSRMAAIDESESLSDIDDVEVDKYLHSKEEMHYKKIIWEQMNSKHETSQGAENANTEGIIAKCDTKFNKKFSTDRLSLK
ncbi:unnamed protein product [Camellia sinensis]